MGLITKETLFQVSQQLDSIYYGYGVGSSTYFAGVTNNYYNNSANIGNNASIAQIKGELGMRFNNITIPKGATINSAIISVYAKGTASGTTVNTIIKGEASDNATQFVDEDVAGYQARPLTTAGVNYNSIPTFTDGNTYNLPDVKTIIQEIVNRVGWNSGNSLVLFWGDRAGNSSNNAGRSVSMYSASPTNAPKITINYSYVPIIGGGPMIFQGGGLTIG